MNTIIDNYLKNVEDRLKEMTDVMLKQSDLVKSLFEGLSADDTIDMIRQNENKIDKMQVELRDDIINCMVLNAPRAGDLRHIVAYYDAIVDVERTGDILYSISKRMHYLQKQHSVFPIFKTDILMLYEMAYSMIHNAVFALFHEDAEIARNIINNDEKLDEQHHICNKKLFEYQYNKREHPYLIADILDLGRIIYGIERIGDNATNIAESAIFLTQGIDIKHRDSK